MIKVMKILTFLVHVNKNMQHISIQPYSLFFISWLSSSKEEVHHLSLTSLMQ